MRNERKVRRVCLFVRPNNAHNTMLLLLFLVCNPSASFLRARAHHNGRSLLVECRRLTREGASSDLPFPNCVQVKGSMSLSFYAPSMLFFFALCSLFLLELVLLCALYVVLLLCAFPP